MKPREFIGDKVEYDEEGGQYIWGIQDDDTLQMVAMVRGWGAIQHLFDDQNDAANFQDEVGKFIADAINEKLERDEKRNS